MRYRRPFTPSQRRAAVAEYRSFCRHLRLLRDEFPPLAVAEREALRAYRTEVEAIGSELQNADDRVNSEELNDRVMLAKVALAEYFRVKHFDS